MSGWGYTVEFKNPSEVLKHLKVPIITNDQCDSDLPEDYQKFMTDDKICAGFLNQGNEIAIYRVFLSLFKDFNWW